jgi:TM2 domain-containing membrane protein YozV
MNKRMVIILIIIILLLIPAYLYSQDNMNNEEDDSDNEINDDNDENTTNIDNQEDDGINDNKTESDLQGLGIEPYEIILPEIVYDRDNVRVKYAGESSIFTPLKDPFMSSILSFMWMGLGQIYVGEKPVMGTILFASELLFLAGGLSTFFILQSEYSTYDDPMVNWNEFSGESKLLVISLLLSYIAFKVYNVLDSYEQAVEYNRKYFGSGYDSNLMMYFTFDINSFSLTIRF